MKVRQKLFKMFAELQTEPGEHKGNNNKWSKNTLFIRCAASFFCLHMTLLREYH